MPHEHRADVPAAAVLEQAARRGLRTAPLTYTIDRDAYTPALLNLVNNQLVWSGSRVFHHLHGIGTNEWRILSALANHPGHTAQQLCDLLGISKSVASKSTTVLLARDLVAQLDGPRGSRHLFLTDAGARVHDELLPVALRREEILHEALSDDEVRQLNGLLLRMLDAAASLQEYEVRMLGGEAAGAADPVDR